MLRWSFVIQNRGADKDKQVLHWTHLSVVKGCQKPATHLPQRSNGMSLVTRFRVRSFDVFNSPTHSLGTRI